MSYVIRGPFAITRDDSSEFPATIRDADGWSVAYITGSAGDARTEAHATLLAAAPRLVEQLQRLTDQHETLLRSQSTEKPLTGWGLIEVEAARELLKEVQP